MRTFITVYEVALTVTSRDMMRRRVLNWRNRLDRPTEVEIEISDMSIEIKALMTRWLLSIFNETTWYDQIKLYGISDYFKPYLIKKRAYSLHTFIGAVKPQAQLQQTNQKKCTRLLQVFLQQIWS